MAITRTLQGEYLEGIGIIQENEAKFPDDPYYAYNSACVYGRALEQVQEEEPTQDRETRLQDYQTEALLLLSKSIRLNLHDLELMRTDPDLDSLRSLDEFKALLQQLEQSAEADTDGTDSEVKE